MKSNIVVALALSSAVGVPAHAAVTPLVPTGPTSTADVIIYEQTSPTTLGVNNALNTVPGLTGILAGNAAAPGGNVELFATSEAPGYTLPAFQSLAPVTLSGTNAGHNVTLRSLNGADWFAGGMTTAYGNNDLANQWLDDFFAAYNYDGFLLSHGISQPAIDASKVTVMNGILVNGGFQRLSDPNIGYANYDSTLDVLQIGLEGSDNYIGSILPGIVIGVFGRPDLVPFLPPVVQASEVVGVDVDGLPTQFLYGFTGTPSGLTTLDDTESYTMNFEVTAAVPEPASLGVIVLGTLALLRRRR